MDFHLERMLKDIGYLTSDETAGRLSGTNGAKKAAEYLVEELESLGYKGVGTNGYFDPVDVPATRLVGPAQLIVNGKEYRHRIDFAELLRVSSGGEIESQLVVVRDGDDIDPSIISGKVVLIPERPEGFDLKGTVSSALEFGVKGILIEYGEPRWFGKTLFGSNRNRVPVLRIRRSLAQQLVDSENVSVRIKLPLETGVLTCQNVLGFLEKSTSDHTILLCAHYDHLGDDPGGFRFPGAIDNAAGVAVVLEAARMLAGSSKPLPFNILVGFLTGEESNLWGARKLVDNPPVPLTAVINVDSLGFEPELVAMRVGHSSPGHWLPNLAAEVIEDFGVEVKWISGGDDSHAFLTRNIPTLGLGQKPTMTSAIKIHTPDDTLSSLHIKPVEKGFHILMEILKRLEQNDLLRVDSPRLNGLA